MKLRRLFFSAVGTILLSVQAFAQTLSNEVLTNAVSY